MPNCVTKIQYGTFSLLFRVIFNDCLFDFVVWKAYCKWCYNDGEFIYKQKDSLVDFLLAHMPNPDNKSDDERREFYDNMLSQLKHWKA